MKSLLNQLSVRKVNVSMTSQDIIEEGLPGVLPKFTVTLKGAEYYVKSGQKSYADCNLYYQISEVIAYEIGKEIGLDICPYEMWEIPANNFMDEYQIDDFHVGSHSTFFDQYLRKEKKLIVSASKTFLPSDDYTYLSADTLIEGAVDLSNGNLIGKDLYQFLISSGYFSEEFVDRMIIFDFIIHNIDRHVNNFGYMMGIDGSIKLAPLFDHGRSLLSDYSDKQVSDYGIGLVDLHPIKPFYAINESLSLVSKSSFNGLNLNIDTEFIEDLIAKYEIVLGTRRAEAITELLLGRLNHVRYKVLS